MILNICEAIEKREIIKFYYDGGSRIVEPFCYGENSRGNIVLRGYQIGGYSTSGESEGWKLFKEDEMVDVSLYGKKFTQIRPHYNPNDKGMVRIICNV